ncbi:MAG: T9SS type A sorting domain-containing protein [Bacteroidales bacterium]|jgi:Leucine-rich repeat (LRR) protein|nr:T9SS type A sorting domain-containing protein [Bacteroidales bacterium]
MKKIYILSVLLLLSSIGVLAQDEVVNIPDARFKQTLLNHDPVIDTNKDGEIQKSEAEAFTGKLDLKNKAIPNLKGIEYFVNITELDCSNRNVFHSKVTQLDISKNINLITLNCSYNELTELILPNSTKLENLYCTYNKLFALDVSGNSGLKKIFCANNKIKNLNIPQNNSIVELECSNNALSDLDVKHIKGLEVLKCDKNILTDIDVNENTQLTLFNCSSNLLKSIDISKNAKLESFSCSNNIISVLDASGNLKLTTINCNRNVISKLNLTNNTLLEELYCAGNEITDIKLAEAKTFNKIICSGNKLKPSQCFTVINKMKDSGVYNYSPQENLFSEINNNKPFTVDYSSEIRIGDKDSEFKWFNRFDKEVDNTEIIMPIDGQSGKFEIKTVGVYYCKISNPALKGEFVTNSVNLNINEKTLNIPDFKFKSALLDIEKLNTNGDNEIQLSEAKVFSGMLDIRWIGINDLSGIEYFENLDSLSCSSNRIINLDLTKNKKLIYLDISRSELSNLDNIPKSQLRYFNCNENHTLEKINLSEFTNLKELLCSRCNLTSLDLSVVPDLELLYCSHNNINELDISGLTKLKKLDCYDNKLSVLDVSKNSLLETLSCSRNSLNSLDVSKNNLLETLSCSHNNIKSLDISKNSKVKKLYIYVNPISELLICDKPLYTEVYCGSTKLNLIDIWNIKKKLPEDCKLGYSTESYKEYKIYQYRSEPELFEVDYSDQAVINGKNTEYKWYSLSKSGVITDNSIIEQVQDSPGKFIIKATGAYYCKLTNSEIPDFSLTTNVVGIYTDSDIVNIPDVVFKSYLVNNKDINTNRDTEIQLSEAKNYTGGIYLSYHYDVEDMTGIESFTNLTTLFISRKNLKMVDLSENIGLLNLSLRDNGLTKISLSKNVNLLELDLSNNSLIEIDLSKNINLKELDLSGNILTKIDVSNQLQLEELNCHGNEIENLDISLNVKLKKLSCARNKLNSLDLSNNPDLRSLGCQYNNLTTLDLSKNEKIEDLYCSSNNLSNLDVSALKSITQLSCSDNELTELDLSNNTKLNTLSCSNNNLTKLDLSDLYSIGEVNCDNNSLTYLNIEKTNHCRLSCSENRLTLSDLQRIKRLNSPYRFSYISNKKAYEPVNGGINYQIDYTADAIIDGNRTKFVWCNAENGTSVGNDAVQEVGNGKFKFKKFGDYYCLMSNESMQVRTNIVSIEGKEQTLNFDPAATAKINDKITLEATTTSNLHVTYQIVSGEATLDGNILTPTAEGTLVVKAIQSGNNEYEPIEKTATIQVSKREQTITFDVKETVKVNDKITLAATPSSGLDVSYEIVSGDATLEANTVTFTEAGKVQIKAKQAGNNEYKAVEKVVTITVTKSTAIDNLSVIGAKIYPNPVTDILNIELPETDRYTVTVFNSTGDIVTQKRASSVNTAIDMSVYNSGIYIIKVTTGNRSYTGKIIKQ